MLSHEPVNPELVSSQRLHDHQVMQLIPFLRKVDLAHTAMRSVPLPGILWQIPAGHAVSVQSCIR